MGYTEIHSSFFFHSFPLQYFFFLSIPSFSSAYCRLFPLVSLLILKPFLNYSIMIFSSDEYHENIFIFPHSSSHLHFSSLSFHHLVLCHFLFITSNFSYVHIPCSTLYSLLCDHFLLSFSLFHSLSHLPILKYSSFCSQIIFFI